MPLIPTESLNVVISEEQIDDLLFFARTGSLSDLQNALAALPSPPSTILLLATDPGSGNSVMHMAAANGHIGVLEYVLSIGLAGDALCRTQNTAGNSPLHYASLAGQLSAVTVLVNAGADVSSKNAAGHDVVYEAEQAGKTEVVEYLLSNCGGLETLSRDANASNNEEGDVRDGVVASKEVNGSHDEENVEELRANIEAMPVGDSKP